MHTLTFILLALFAAETPTLAQQPQQEKATEAITVRHSPNPSEGYLWQRPKDKFIGYKWPHRTEVKNNLDVPLQITHFGIYCYENGEWALRSLPYTSAEFSKRYDAEFSKQYDDGDPVIDGWIPPGKVAVNAENWTGTWLLPVPPRTKWTYTANDSAGNVYHAEEEIELTPVLYRYHAGDDTAWAQPEFDDRDWEQIKSSDFPADRWQGIGWFRCVLQVDSLLWHQPLGFRIFNIFGAVEFYLDGKLVHRVGKIAASKEEEKAYYRMWDPVPISFHPPPGQSGGKSRHVVAIRYSSFFWDSPTWSGQRPWTIGWYMGDLKQMTANRAQAVRKESFHQMLLTGVFLAFALLHLLLFLFYPRLRANLYFAALTACFALLVYFWFQLDFITDAVHYVWHIRWRNAALTLMTLSAIRLTYLLLYPKLPRILIPFFLVGLGLTLWNWLRPLIIPTTHLIVFYIAAFAEIARVFVAFRIRKREVRLEGSWIILLGMIPFALIVVYYLLGALNFVPLPWQFEDFPAPFYAMLILMISMSIFLSRNFAQTNKNLEAQLIQVKALSEKTIQQEREKAQLEAENARKTKELEEARKLQLSMLPKIVPQLPNLEIAVYMQTATEVGGDYYDFKVHDDGTLTAAIGDATGHGVHAGTMVAATKSLFNSLADEPEPIHILKKATKALKAMGFREMYMALTVAKFKDHQLQISAAGMPFAMIYRAASGHAEEVELKGMPLGSFPDFPYEQQALNLSEGDVVLFMSDGFPERFNTEEEMLGEERAKVFFEQTAHESPEQIIARLLEDEKAWANGRPQDDDVTFVVMKMK